MLIRSLRSFIYKLCIKFSIKLYLFSNVLFQRTRWLAIRLTKLANKFEGYKLIKEINYGKKYEFNLEENFYKNIDLNKLNIKDKYQFKYITPLFPYFICDHYISMELNKSSKYNIFTNLKINGTDLIKNKKLNCIKNFDTVHVQVDLFDFFHDTVLPYLEKNNIKIILITSQFHFPSIQKSFKTENCINHPSIIMWISQNPIYKNKKNYMGIPYGLDHRNINNYVNFLDSNKLLIRKKDIYISNLYTNLHINNLSKNHIRNKYKTILCDKKKRLPYEEYLKVIAGSKFLISPAGDREDCYRHYEAIGLSAIPISNISKNFKNIFQKNMLFTKDEDLIKIIKLNKVDKKYNIPNKNILLNSYWLKKINNNLKKIKII